MPLTYIKGSFRIVGSSPDGDSLRFAPIDPDAFIRAGIAAAMNTAGSVLLRLEGIDALESRFTTPGGGPQWHQPVSLSDEAAASLLRLLGFDHVDRDAAGYVAATIPDTTYGYILTQMVDSHGRAVAMVFPGMRSGMGLDGDLVSFGVPELLSSVNYQLLAAGSVYPTFYSKLFTDARDVLASAAAAARASRAGIWEHEVTLTGFELRARSQLMDELVLMPKLFRRLAEYLALDPTGGVDLAGFATFLALRADQIFVPPSSTLATFDTLVEVEEQYVRLTLPPERMVFIEE